jgi:protein HOOK3
VLTARKRLYRLLLSFPLSPPRPPSLSLSSLSEPDFSSIARSPTTKEGTDGLLQICRLCLAISVWAAGNEKVITRIRDLGEGHMAYLMKSIEEVMATLPEVPEVETGGGESSEKGMRGIS